jgi:hypothetical protein
MKADWSPSQKEAHLKATSEGPPPPYAVIASEPGLRVLIMMNTSIVQENIKSSIGVSEPELPAVPRFW